MSSTSTLPASTGPTPSESSSNSGGSGTNDRRNDPSKVYLLAFLVSLILLLIISSMIAARSFMVRRAMRRRILAAVAAGTYGTHPSDVQSRRKRDFGPTPVLWEASAAVSSMHTWQALMPIAAHSLPISEPAATKVMDTSSQPPSNSALGPFWRRRAAATSVPMPAVSDAGGLRADPSAVEHQPVQISMLIAMPSAHNSRLYQPPSFKDEHHDSISEEFPDVVFGIAQLTPQIMTLPSSTP